MPLLGPLPSSPSPPLLLSSPLLSGTLDYMAPEVLRCPPKNLPQENKNNAYLHYNNSVDAWAVGVFAYELVGPWVGEGFWIVAGDGGVPSLSPFISPPFSHTHTHTHTHTISLSLPLSRAAGGGLSSLRRREPARLCGPHHALDARVP